MNHKKFLLTLLTLCFAFLGVARAQLHLTVNGHEVDTVRMGNLPSGCWVEPLTFTLSTDDTPYMVSTLVFTPSYSPFSLSHEAGFMVYPNNPQNVQLTCTANGQGLYDSQLVIAYEERGQFVKDVRAYLYQPAIPDVFEYAHDLGTLNDNYNFASFMDDLTQTELHNDYTLPFPEIPDGNDAVFKFTVTQDMELSASVSTGENGKVALYTEDFDGQDGPRAFNNYTGLPFSESGSAGPIIQHLSITPGTYYLVASSSWSDFEVSIATSSMPCPLWGDVTLNMEPYDGATNIDPSSVGFHWDVPYHATSWRLVLGDTDNPVAGQPTTVITDWSDVMTKFYTVRNLTKNHRYYWHVEFKNNNCPDGMSTPTLQFTTKLDVPQNLVATDETVFEDEQITLSWNAINDDALRTYYIYRDGYLIDSTTNTSYTHAPLAYNMSGYTYYVTAVYSAGESAPSNTVNILVSGYGNVNGYVYELDGTTGIANAIVTMVGQDEFGNNHTYIFSTNAQGYYSGRIHAGSCNGSATCDGYQSSNAPVQGNPIGIGYNATTSPINYLLERNQHLITATSNPEEGGVISGAGIHDHFNTCTLIATNNVGYHLVNWTVNSSIVSTSDTLEVVVTQDSTFVANFELNSYQITADATVGGSASGTGTYQHFDSCTLVATNTIGYHFVNWTVNDSIVSSETTYKFEVTSPGTYLANFAINSYLVTTTSDPEEGGILTGGGTYDHGATATLSAEPNEGYRFLRWTTPDGSLVTTESSFQTEVTEAAEYVAHFTTKEYEIVAVCDPNAGTLTGAGTYNHFETCTLTAFANEGYRFLNWRLNGANVSSDSVYSFVVTGNATFAAIFRLKRFTVVVNAEPAEGGTVSGAGAYDWGTTATLTAHPNPGYHLASWVVDGQTVSTEPTCLVTVTNTTFVTANFAVNTYDIATLALPEEGGSTTGGGTFTHGQTCALSATPNTGYHFVNWTLNDSVVSASPGYQFDVTGSGTYVAHFEINSYEIQASADPAEGGSVEGAGSYNHFDICALSASPATGYHFLHWTLNGGVVTDEPEFQFQVAGPAAYVAHFEINSYVIAASAEPAEGGTVAGDGTYDHFALCTLTATPLNGYHFLHWTLDGSVVSNSASYQFQVSGPADYVAHFALNGYDITASADPDAGGTVSGAGSYQHFETCTLSAVSNTGYHFLSWTLDGSVVSTEPEYQFQVSGPADYVAHFEINSYVVAASAEPSSGGTVSGAGNYDHFASCTLTATPSVGYHFLHWTLDGVVVGTEPDHQFQVTGPASFVAHFELNSYVIAASASPEDCGTVSGAGTYDHGATCTLTAAPATGYHFVRWTRNGANVSSSRVYSFTVTAPGEYVAHFTLASYTVSAIANPQVGGSVSGTGVYQYGATATLHAEPNDGYEFVKWTKQGTVVSTEPDYSFTVNGTTSLVAHFAHGSHNVTVAASPEDAGTVSGAGTYDHGATATIQAAPYPGFRFLCWCKDGQVVSHNASYSFTVNADSDFTALFESLPTHSIAVEQVEGVTLSAPESAYVGQTVTVATQTEPGFRLVSLFYYTDDPDSPTAINLHTKQFLMPDDDVTVSALSLPANKGDVNLDGLVNVVDVIAAINFIIGNDPQPFDFDNADMNCDGVVDISDALAINAYILGLKPDCHDLSAQYALIEGTLYVDSDVALAGFQLSLGGEPLSVALDGFSAMGNWVDGEYRLAVFSLGGELEPGIHPVLELGDTALHGLLLATREGCPVRAEEGILNASDLVGLRYSVYPVPANDELTIEGQGIRTIEVFDLLGQRLVSLEDVNSNLTRINVSALAPGSYFVRINGNVTKKIMVK